MKKSREKEFRKTIDKLYKRYDKDSNGILEWNELKDLLVELLGRNNVNDDLEAVLRLCKCENTKAIPR